MSKPHLVYAPIDISFSELQGETEIFLREFHKLNESDNDPIGQWLKLKKAKGETQDSDDLVLEILVNIHRRLDKMELLIKNEKEELIKLDDIAKIENIGFSHFELKNSLLKPSKKYYGRISMKTYPERDVPVFFEAVDSKLAIISKFHAKDETEWNSYFRARERVMIRERNQKKQIGN
jgi:hypothetical protein